MILICLKNSSIEKSFYKVSPTEVTYPTVVLHKGIFWHFQSITREYDKRGIPRTCYVYRPCRGSHLSDIRIKWE